MSSEQQLKSSEQQLKSSEQRVASSEHHSLFGIRYPSFATRYSLLANRYSLLATCFSLLAALLSSCNPWVFTMQRHTGWDIEGKIYTNHQQVDLPTDNLVIVEAPASIAMRCYQITDGTFDAEFTLARDGGGGLELRFDSTPYEDTVLRSGRGERITIDQQAVTVAANGTTTTVPVVLPPAGTPFRVVLVRHGRYLDVEVACTTIGQFRIDDASTQWLSIVPAPEQRVEVRDPQFRPLVEL